MIIKGNPEIPVVKKLNQFKKKLFELHRIVHIRPTQKCPLCCKHCSANASMNGVSASIEELRKWIENISHHGATEWIGIEGGEPFIVLPQLRTMLAACREYGLEVALLTSGFWAESRQKAKSILKSLPSPGLLTISADEFHQEQVSFEQLRIAIAEAIEWTENVAIQVCLNSESSFLDKLYSNIGEELISRVAVILVPLRYSGRARSTGVVSKPPVEKGLPESRPCRSLCTPVVREDGLFTACCQQDVVLREKSSILHLGNLTKDDAGILIRKADQDVYIQTLRTYGFRPIADFALEYGYDWFPQKVYKKGGNCDLCRELSRRLDIVEGFRNHHDNDQYRLELTIARSILYQE